MAWSLDARVATVLGSCPGYAYHTCWPGEAALSGCEEMDGVAGAICQTRTPSFSSLSMVRVPFQA